MINFFGIKLISFTYTYTFLQKTNKLKEQCNFTKTLSFNTTLLVTQRTKLWKIKPDF